VQIKDLKKAIVDGQEFIKLADGSLGALPPEWINKFVLKIKADDVKGIIISEAKRYFNNWIKIELKNIDKKDIKHTRMTTNLYGRK
jgi:hypothetical protein